MDERRNDDDVLECCYDAVEKLAEHIDEKADGNECLLRDRKLFFQTFGATIANYLLQAEEQSAPGASDMFIEGFNGYLKFLACKDADRVEVHAAKPMSLHLLDFFDVSVELIRSVN